MMKTMLRVLAFLFLPLCQMAQSPDSLMRQIREMEGVQYAKIIRARELLRDAFTEGDMAAVNNWLGFLQTELQNEDYAATLPDERWMLYCWTENFGQLFEEVAGYDTILARRQTQIDPPEDDLFRIVDQSSFDRRYELFGYLQRGFLSEEEKAFGALLLDYLLRTDSDEAKRAEKNAKVEAFLKKYPTSRFKNYLYRYVYDRFEWSKNGFVLDLLVNSGRHDGAMGINFKPQWSLGLSLGWWHRKFNLSTRVQFGGQAVRREFRDGGLYILPDSNAFALDLGLESGFDLVNTRRLHIMPALGFGWSHLRVSDTPEFIDDPVSSVRFNSLYWNACLNIDYKFWQGDHSAPVGMPQQWWTAFRVRIGYKALYFKRENPELGGSQIFVGMGFSLFTRPGVKHKIR